MFHAYPPECQGDVNAMQNFNLVSADQPSLSSHILSHGSASTQYVQSISNDFSILSGPDIADIAHYLCVLHGRYPGVVDYAATKTADENSRKWLIEAMDGFAAERSFITKLTVAAGPISGVSRDDQSNSAVLGQRKALEMLSQSDRNGCALGSAFAMILDWEKLRPVLEKIAIRVGVEARSAQFPTDETTDELNQILAQSPAVGRAIRFGADQLLSQHRGLWQLLSARRETRSVY